MSKKISYILIFALSALLIAGIAIGAVVLARQDNFDKEITLTQDGSVKEEMQFSLEGLYPGQSAEYSIHIDKAAADSFSLSIVFRSEGSVGLAPYVYAELEMDGKTVSEGELEEYLDGEKVALTLSKGSDSVLVIRYQMPIEVGNEAQGMIADFVVEIEASPAA